jgi:hypothetical protein
MVEVRRMENNKYKKGLIFVVLIMFFGISLNPITNGYNNFNYIEFKNFKNSISFSNYNLLILLIDDFEDGWNQGYADSGIWEIGTPEMGPSEPHLGNNCAGTILNGTYPSSTDSRLVTPSIVLPSLENNQEILFRFWHWYRYDASDYAYVEIQTYNTSSEKWNNWEKISRQMVSTSNAWSVGQVDISNYQGKKVHVAFAHYADPWPWGEVSDGWYIDNVSIPGLFQDNNPPSVSIVKPENAFYFFDEKIRNFLLPLRTPLIIGKITLEAKATDQESGINKVEFYVCGKLIGNDTLTPYTYQWKSNRPRILHLFMIKVVAYDNVGNTDTDKMIVRKFL